ncbi:hypothetical protein FRB99_001985 [Tulasnella sp. 403]|nr:hypothetical protein FRB99_001985 [Tulasnella sp. 403]
MARLNKLLVASLAFIPASVTAWGTLAHKTIAAVAINYLLPDAQSAVNDVLANDPDSRHFRNPTLIDVAPWADSYRSRKDGRFSAGFHYIDARDDPENGQCGVELRRDCPRAGCVVSAIANYTTRLTEQLDAYETAQALKFLVHFVGDVTQPLHNEESHKGGNGVPVEWNGHRDNLHSIWDTDMVEELAGKDNVENLNAWTQKIVGEINNGIYASSLSSWVSCADVHGIQNCALQWSQDANAKLCAFVMNPVPGPDDDLETYYEGAAPIIQEQVAKGGVRLAALLNNIYTGQTGFPASSEAVFRIQEQ